MRLLFIGHTYHLKTKSSVFLLEMLQQSYDVTEHYMDPAAVFDYSDMKKLKEKQFDVMVVWQVMPKIAELAKYVSWKRAVFFPMYDHYAAHHGFYADIWSDYKNFMIISFSRTLYDDLVKAGFDARYIQYFPQPCKVGDWGSEQSLFFWQRLSILNFGTLAKAVKNLVVKNIHLHEVPDPGHMLLPPSAYGRETVDFFKDITFSKSKWFKEKEQLTQTLEKSALYMAPRHLEGIGMSFLEAMAHGRCVIAPDNPTMNEYIVDGVNGLLYPWKEDSDVHCDEAVKCPVVSIRQLQEKAYQTIVDGYEKWSSEKYKILEWLELEAQPDKGRLNHSAVQYGWKDWPIDDQPWPDAVDLEKRLMVKLPTRSKVGDKLVDVSVVTVVFNAVNDGRHEMFMQCLESVQMQTGICVEHIIVDGASTDGTLQLAKDFVNENHTMRILSMKDHGIYDAMNRGIALAKGDYIVFLNSDDYYHEADGLKASVDMLRQTGCSFSFAPVRIINDTLPDNPHANPAEYINEVFFHSVFSHQSVLVRRNVMLQMHGFDLSYRSAADYDFILRMILTGLRGCYVNRVFVSYRMIGVSSTNLNLSGHETALVYKRLFNQLVGARLTGEEAYRLHRYREYPKNDSSLKVRLSKIMEKAFIGLPKKPKVKSLSYRYELGFVLRSLLHFKIKLLFYFMIIHFNSRFNREWYLKTYKDVKLSKTAPAAHYLLFGWLEGRDPSPRFSTNSYLKNNPDVEQMNICPLVHWKLKGKRERRVI